MRSFIYIRADFPNNHVFWFLIFHLTPVKITLSKSLEGFLILAFLTGFSIHDPPLLGPNVVAIPQT